MINQKSNHNKHQSQFTQLATESPQIKAGQAQKLIQDLNLEDQHEFKFKSNKKTKRRKNKEKSTNLIKIKPVENSENQERHQFQIIDEINISNQPQTQSNYQIAKTNKNKQYKSNEANQTMESPVLYKISDEQDIQPNQQAIPQSSRRPLKESPKSDKKSDSDELQSPTKLIKSPRKVRTKIKTQGENHRRFIKMRKQIEIAGRRQPTQIYEYNGDKQKQQQNNGEGSQQQQENQQEQINDSLNNSNQNTINQQKPQVIVFKSNSFFTLINAQIPKGNFVNCIIKRKRGDDYFQKIVTYELFLLQDKKYLMTCIKDRLFKTTSNFQFYRQKPNTLKYHKENLYAYLNSNFTGTQFILKTIQKNDTNSQKSTAVDKSDLIRMQDSMSVISDQPQKNTSFFPNQKKINKNQDILQSTQEKQTCFISFKANFFGFGGQRDVKILKKKNKKLKKSGNFSDLKTAQQNGQIDKYVQFSSRKATLGKNGLQMDFKGIAKIQSTKNIILQNQSQKEVLIFGKVKQDIYSIAIGHPLSIIEGLSFGIANLDRKFFVN